MGGTPDRFTDLRMRTLTALSIAAIGLFAVWAGGVAFLALVAAIVGALIWELARMLAAEPYQARILGLAATAALALAWLLPVGFGLPVLLLVAMAGLGLLHDNRALFLIMGAIILLAALGILALRQDHGLIWMVWLVLVVVVTDVFGYFAGRVVGGPRFWPRVSPKKTWSGTIAGWVAAALVGLGFMRATGSGVELIGISVALSMASQIGDIAESAVKRRMGVKDSSNLLPGHGGVFDRFDGMVGAALVLLLVQSLSEFPPTPL